MTTLAVPASGCHPWIKMYFTEYSAHFATMKMKPKCFTCFVFEGLQHITLTRRSKEW